MNHRLNHRQITATVVSAFSIAVLLFFGAYASAGAAPITGPHQSTTQQRDIALYEVPTWMRQQCNQRRLVNCYDPELDAYYRAMPRSGGDMTCVFYVRHPRWDYCS